MEFKVNSKELEKLLTKIIPAVPTRTPMPILENFLFEIKDNQLTIIATDLEISMKSSLNIKNFLLAIWFHPFAMSLFVEFCIFFIL